MAVSGSGGWVPSATFIYRNKRLVRIGIVQNKPKEVLVSLEDAAKSLFGSDGNKIVTVDIRRTNHLELVDMLYALEREKEEFTSDVKKLILISIWIPSLFITIANAMLALSNL